MDSKSLLTAIGICVLSLLLNYQITLAGELIIHDQGSLTIKTNSVLKMNCENLTIESGGIFTLDGGAVERRGQLILQPGGQYIKIFGTESLCNNSMGQILLLLLEEE